MSLGVGRSGGHVMKIVVRTACVLIPSTAVVLSWVLRWDTLWLAIAAAIFLLACFLEGSFQVYHRGTVRSSIRVAVTSFIATIGGTVELVLQVTNHGAPGIFDTAIANTDLALPASDGRFPWAVPWLQSQGQSLPLDSQESGTLNLLVFQQSATRHRLMGASGAVNVADLEFPGVAPLPDHYAYVPSLQIGVPSEFTVVLEIRNRSLRGPRRCTLQIALDQSLEMSVTGDDVPLAKAP